MNKFRSNVKIQILSANGRLFHKILKVNILNNSAATLRKNIYLADQKVNCKGIFCMSMTVNLAYESLSLQTLAVPAEVTG